jgi:hypothetical protein
LATPGQIARHIPPIVVESIETVFEAWTSPYMGKKCLEVVYPFRSYGDTTTPIIGISSVVRIQATSL